MSVNPNSGWWTLLVFASLLTAGCGRGAQYDQYYVQGQQLYTRHCSNCHQSDGKGLGLLYPPVDNSDYMTENFEGTLCLMKHGITGELVVNGKSFNHPMPGVSTLTDLEIAEIATYIYNMEENGRGIVHVSEAVKTLNRCPQ